MNNENKFKLNNLNIEINFKLSTNNDENVMLVNYARRNNNNNNNNNNNTNNNNNNVNNNNKDIDDSVKILNDFYRKIINEKFILIDGIQYYKNNNE